MHTDHTIHNELKSLSIFLAGIPNTNVFTVPDGFFENLPADILYNIDHDQSVNELSKTTVAMEIPEGYFDGLADNIMNKIRSIEYHEISGETDTAFPDAVKNNNIYQVPSGYFDSLADNIMSSIRFQEHRDISKNIETAFIDDIKHLNIYDVPAGYFNSLADIIIKTLPQPVKVVTMKKRSYFSNYAIAAAITGLLGLSLFTIFDKKPQNGLFSQQSSAAFAEADQDVKINFDKALETLGDDEIVSFLQSNGEDVNAALVASVTDENNLPNEEEYFIDEQTLDKFLNDQHIIQTN